ncbi:PadR family transcriptional regulator [Fictibacillus iocasae]|uniref:PadR family transcriptional regulator n=1 Tax=Fictibacillus iocasae TaxID=2715437 RepID=A0ABW2NTY4_9BACL
MSLRYGLLGFLSKWEATGYDIKKEFDDIMSIFWHSHLSQIYPELNKLEQEGLISSQLIPQMGKPDKKLYSMTQKGKSAFITWLLSPQEAAKRKDSFLMQTFFMDNIPFEEALLKIKMNKKEHELRLEHMKSILEERWKDIKERKVMNARIISSSAILKQGIEQEIQSIKWCDQTIQLMEECKDLWDLKEDHVSIERFSVIERLLSSYFKDVL